ncbi:MAG: hypothetical protein K0Q83_279 [Deltaproteobacteria bacterium]|jgi:hypothetical protein|nr:hypothetical protein [Deltaproteobacteria bacterium]
MSFQNNSPLIRFERAESVTYVGSVSYECIAMAWRLGSAFDFQIGRGRRLNDGRNMINKTL